MAIVFRRFSWSFDIFINIHEYANEIILIRTMTSKHLSYYITGSITQCHNENSLFMDFNYFSVNIDVFIKLHEYAN